MSERLSIREVEAGDHGALRDLWAGVWPATYAAALGPAAVEAMIAELDATDLATMLPGSGERAAAAFLDDRLIGSVVAAKPRAVAYVWGMYVDRDHQRSGIGRALMAHAAAWVGDATALEVRALETSPWAIAFYEHLGFRRIGADHLDFAPGHRVAAAVMSIEPSVLLAAPGSDGGWRTPTEIG